MANTPGKRLSNNRARIARTRPPYRDETSLSGQALEYDLQHLLMEDDVKRIAQSVVIDTGGGGDTGISDVNLIMPIEYDVIKTTPTGAVDFLVEWLAQNANKLLAGPASGSDSIPTFRYQVNNDLPARSRISIIPTAFGATVQPDASLGSQFSLVATSNFTLLPPINMLDGQKITIRVTQDATGSRAWTLDPAYRRSTFLTTAVCQLTTTPLATDYFGVEYNADAGAFDILSYVPGVM